MYAIVHMDVADAICRVYLPILKKKKRKKQARYSLVKSAIHYKFLFLNYSFTCGFGTGLD